MTNGGNPFDENDDPVLYPRHKDPFTKRTKSVKQMRKREKKNMKEQQKLEKKEDKSKKKKGTISNGTEPPKNGDSRISNNNKNTAVSNDSTRVETRNDSSNSNLKIKPSLPILANGSSTLPAQKSPDGQTKLPPQGYQTLNARSPTSDPQSPPIFTNKRILELKSPGTARPPSTPSTSAESRNKKQTYVPTKTPTPDSNVVSKRPDTLTLSGNANGKKKTTSPLTDTNHVMDDITRVRRSSSVSKLNKEKKKRKKKLKRRLGKKRKSDRGQELNVLEDKEAMNQVVMRPKPNLAHLQKEVEETENILRNSVVNLVNQRDSMLETMLGKSEQLEERAYDFAQVANEAKLKQKARNTCCGIGSKYRICWYICACNTGVRRKKKSSRAAGSPESDKLLSPRVAADLAGDTEDDCYKRTTPPKKAFPLKSSQETALNHKDRNGYKGSTNSLANRLSHLPAAVRGSMPNLLKKESPGKDDTEGIFPRRKSSSVSSAQEVMKKINKKQLEKEKKEKERREKDYRSYAAAQFEDEESRSRAISLLRMDDRIAV